MNPPIITHPPANTQTKQHLLIPSNTKNTLPSHIKQPPPLSILNQPLQQNNQEKDELYLPPINCIVKPIIPTHKKKRSKRYTYSLSPFTSEEKFALWVRLKFHALKQSYISDPYNLLLDNLHLTTAFLSILLLTTLTIPSLLTRLSVRLFFIQIN